MEEDYIVVDYIDDDYEEDDGIEISSIKVSSWIRQGTTFRPTIDLELQKKVDPGLYCVEFSRDWGYYCKKLDIISDDLFIPKDSMVQPILDEINLFWEKKDVYKENKLVHKRGILLEGFAGTGKSSLISLLVTNLINKGGVVFKVMDEENLMAYLSFIRNSFRYIEQDTPIITIIEDIDRYEREDVLLDFLDGKTSLNHHVVLATTNNTSAIADTFLRPSRLDLRIELPLPSKETRKDYFLFKKISEKLLDNYAEQTEGFSFADLKEVFITTHLLNYTLEDAINKIKHPNNKKNYLNKKLRASNYGL
jgi:hypothetical protein